MDCLIQQNMIGSLCNGTDTCDILGQLPAISHKPIKELFDFAFDLLTDLGIRDRHYKKIYDAIDCHICPFCGCEFFDAPGAPREDLDHYLLKSLYPFSAANLNNLAPMGMRCNERYKHEVNILKGADGSRRKVFDPYANTKIEIDLKSSIPFNGIDGYTPDWIIHFNPYSQECDTWDDVFKIRERFKRDVLDPSFKSWLKHFSVWFKRKYKLSSPTFYDVQSAMYIYIEDLKILGFSAREFLRPVMFTMLHHHCVNGDVRLNQIMVDIVS